MLPTEMPAIRTRYFATNAQTRLIERIEITPETQLKFKDVGKTHRKSKPITPRPPVNRRTLQERLQLQEEARQGTQKLGLLARLKKLSQI